MKFFEASDFESVGFTDNGHQHIADIANVKLEREGKVVRNSNGNWQVMGLGSHPFDPKYGYTQQALLINIEPIVKCEHPSEKITTTESIVNGFANIAYCCECGVSVKPKSFEVCE